MKPDIKQVEDLHYLFEQVMGHIFLSPYSNPTFNEMSGAQMKIVHFLGIKGTQKMSGIARQVSVTMAAATAVVDKLVRAGLVVRQQDPSDRRVVRVALSAKGRRTLERLNLVHEGRLMAMLEHLEPPQRRELIAAFRRIHELLSEIQSAARKKESRGKRGGDD